MPDFVEKSRRIVNICREFYLVNFLLIPICMSSVQSAHAEPQIEQGYCPIVHPEQGVSVTKVTPAPNGDWEIGLRSTTWGGSHVVTPNTLRTNGASFTWYKCNATHPRAMTAEDLKAVADFVRKVGPQDTYYAGTMAEITARNAQGSNLATVPSKNENGRLNHAYDQSKKMSPINQNYRLGVEVMAVAYGDITGIYVKKVYSEGRAFTNGIAVGDVILEVDGHSLSNLDDFLQKIGSISDGRGYRLKVARKIKIRDVYLKPTS